VLDEVSRWRVDGRPAVVARVVPVADPEPGRLGPSLFVGADGDPAGRLGTTADRSPVVAAARAMLAGAEAVGRCVDHEGATVLLAPVDWSVHGAVADALAAPDAMALVTVVDGASLGATMAVGRHGRVAGDLGRPSLTAVVARDALADLASRHSGVRRYGPSAERGGRQVAVFVESFNRPAPT
ncbi:MAG: XdhC family protein, partial [Acidimicrobiales bacterium]